MDSLPNIGIKAIHAITRCRQEKLYYRIDLSPIPRGYANGGAYPFTLHLDDVAGFRLVEVPIPATDITRIVDSLGAARALQINGTTPTSAADCAEIASWGLLWRF